MNTYKLGIDIGSTTVKIAILDENNQILFSDYERHFANIQETLQQLLEKAVDKLGTFHVHPVITGSGGLTLVYPFECAVYTRGCCGMRQPYRTMRHSVMLQSNWAVRMPKSFTLPTVVEQRMNGICAGGTGSFIDQMATLLQTDASGLNEYAKNYKSIYPIAARCGVFAKSDIQPLINEGATKEDLVCFYFSGGC